MCGIAGIISIRGSKQLGGIEEMLSSIEHRGPDGKGIYHYGGVTLGHRRLSIIDTSVAGHQPLEYQGRYIITYNGEIYNYIELREELKKAGYLFTSNTDTEVIIASYDYWGINCLSKLNGMWAFVLYDKEQDEFVISRDRFGIKPLYYYCKNDTFIFASEIKSILAHPSVDAQPNEDSLRNYLKYGCSEYTKETTFSEIYRFDFSSFFLGKREGLFTDFKSTRFWKLIPNLSREKFIEEKAEEYAKKYYLILKDAVRLRMRSDVAIGSALSGGLDSSSIAYLINGILKEQKKDEFLNTFSSVYCKKGTIDCDESYFIDLISHNLSIKSNKIEPKEKNIPFEHRKLIHAMDNPPESTCMSGWYTFKLVSQKNIKVTLDGQGADEQLAGYLSYLRVYLPSLSLIVMFKEAIYFYNVPGARKYVCQGIFLGIFKRIVGNFLFKKFVKVILRKNVELDLNSQLVKDLQSKLINLIHYSDRVSMAHSVESRMPYMDYRLVEFLASVPACYKIHNGWTKYIARLAFNKKLPDEVTWRKDKKGWPIPESYWFSNPLKEWFLGELRYNPSLKFQVKKTHDKKKISSKKRIIKLIRYLNVSVWYQNFIIK